MTSTYRFRPAMQSVWLVKALAIIEWGQSAPRSVYSELVGKPVSAGQDTAGALITPDCKGGSIIRVYGNAL
jgi:hypothetical protein